MRSRQRLDHEENLLENQRHAGEVLDKIHAKMVNGMGQAYNLVRRSEHVKT